MGDRVIIENEEFKIADETLLRKIDQLFKTNREAIFDFIWVI